MKRLLICALALFFLASPFFVARKMHDAHLNQLQNDLATFSRSSHSVLVARHGAIGNFANGNHLDYWAVELRSNPAFSSKVGNDQARSRLQKVNDHDDAFRHLESGEQSVQWTRLPSPLPAHFRLRVGNSSEWDLSRFVGQRNLYKLQIVQSGENDSAATFFDWRGN